MKRAQVEPSWTVVAPSRMLHDITYNILGDINKRKRDISPEPRTIDHDSGVHLWSLAVAASPFAPSLNSLQAGVRLTK